MAKVSLSAADQEQCEQLEQDAAEAVQSLRYELAGDLARQVLAKNPRSAKARAILGMVILQRAAREAPMDLYGARAGEYEMELARQLDPESVFVGWMHAEFLAESGHMSAAAAAAEEALGSSATATVAERAGLLGAAATYRYELGEERAARPHLEAYVALRPDDSKALFRLGSSLLTIANTPQGSPPPYVTAQRDAEQAAEAFRRCYTLAPGDVDAAIAMSTAWVRAAELADLQGNAEERDALRDRAGAHLAELAAKFPKNAEVQFCIGALAELQARPKVAQAAYVASLDRDDDHLGSLMNLAALVAADGKLDSARSLYARLLAAPKAQVSLTRRERQRIERWLLDAAKAPADGGDGAQTAPDRRERS